MRKIFLLSLTIALALVVVLVLTATGGRRGNYKTIEDGMLQSENGKIIVPGYDKWGYNYQTHTYNGLLENVNYTEPPVDSGTILQMKWNDAWLSNMDCDKDGKLDRHYGYECYKGSGAWVTNSQRGMCMGKDGTPGYWEYFVKIIAAPVNAKLQDGIWYTVNGEKIGPVIWEEFAIMKEVYNDPSESGEKYYSPPIAPGRLKESNLMMGDI